MSGEDIVQHPLTGLGSGWLPEDVSEYASWDQRCCSTGWQAKPRQGERGRQTRQLNLRVWTLAAKLMILLLELPDFESVEAVEVQYRN